MKKYIRKMIMVLVIIIALSGLCYLLYLVHGVTGQVASLQKSLSYTRAMLTTQQKATAALQNTLEVYERQEKSGDEYLSEIENLVRLAAFHLAFEGNTTAAYQLLQAADEKAQSAGTLGWSIRQALAKDMVAVQAVQRVDLPGLVSRLNALSLQVESLPRALEVEPATQTPPPTHSEVMTWKERFNQAGHKITEGLGRLFIIQHDAPQAAPLLPPDQYVYVITNIQSQLAMAEWAALYRSPEIYQQSLSKAEEWVRRYFEDQHSETRGFLRNLNVLLSVPIKPELPDLADSLQQIEIARRSGGGGAQATPAPKTEIEGSI